MPTGKTKCAQCGDGIKGHRIKLKTAKKVVAVIDQGCLYLLEARNAIQLNGEDYRLVYV